MKVFLRYLLLALYAGLFISSASAVYDPRMGRWLSRDPIGEDGGFNLYAYCGNDPVNRHDPLGLAWNDTPLINAGDFPVGSPFFDPESQKWLVKMRHLVALTLDGRLDVATDSVMGLTQAQQLAPNPGYWRKQGTSPTLLSGTGFQGVDAADISNYIRQHPGFRAEKVVLGTLPALAGGYGFGLAAGVLGEVPTMALGFYGSAELGHQAATMYVNGAAWDDWAMLGTSLAGGAVTAPMGFGAGSSMRGPFVSAFTPQKFTLGGGMMVNTRAAEAGSAINPFGELMGESGSQWEAIVDVLQIRGIVRPEIRTGVRSAVELAAPRGPNGEWVDATTGELFTGQYHLGHKPAFQWKLMKEKFEAGFWTQDEINDFMNDPSFYQIEKPFNNVSGLFDRY